MLHLHKISQIAAVDPAMRVIDYERQLNSEGFTGGYRPVSGYQSSLSACLAERTANLFSLKYGGIEDICAGGTVTTPLGTAFTIKDYPRAATGPDLRRVLIGAGGLLGHFSSVSLKVFPLPEAQSWGLALFDRTEEAFEALRRMIGHFVRPLFVRILEEEEGGGLLRSLNLAEASKVVLAFKLAGLKGMVEAEREGVVKLHEGESVLFHWPGRPAEVEVLDQTLITKEAYLDFCERSAPLTGRKPSAGGGPVPGTGPAGGAEESLKKFFKENPC
ncbi:MAG: FAD-binding protein [Deltaproteobacteria bacterium]|nr:FAD-binding protein [Deltaproteobacteria bacterium]